MGKTSNKERWKIQGKTYYKDGETPVTEDMLGIIDEIWDMSNPKGETFKLLIRRGRSNSFALYDMKDRCILRTYSISKIGEQKCQ